MTDRPIDADVAPGVEIAEIGPDFVRRVGEVAGVRNRPDPAAVELADDDLLFGEVYDKGHGSGTLVAKGDPIPAHLAALPRRPAAPREVRKR